MRPSPAREAAPEPEVWLPITDLGEILELEVAVWASELSEIETDPAAGSGNVTVVATPAVVEPALAPPPAPAPAPARAVPTAPARVVPTAPARVVPTAPARVPAPQVAPALGTPAQRGAGTRPAAPPRPRLVEAAVLGAAVAVVAVGALLLLGPSRHDVRVRVDGATFARTSGASTVRALLRDEHVRLRHGDRVVPGPDTTLASGMTISVERAPAVAVASSAGTVPAPASVAAPPSTVPAPPTPATAAPAVATTAPATAPPTTATTASTTTTSTTAVHHAVPAHGTQGRASGGASWYRSPWGSDSCASRTLPFGTMVRIVRRDTGASATCRVADRGPMNHAWVLDLDDNVFRQLSPLGIGVIPVSISW